MKNLISTLVIVVAVVCTTWAQAEEKMADPSTDSTAPIPVMSSAITGNRAFDSMLQKWKQSRGLMQIPTRGSANTLGPCDSFHHNPNLENGQVTDTYADPLSACAFMAVLQEWRRSSCKDSSQGCRISWGDVSHPKRENFGAHRNGHRDGRCFDFRPMRAGEFMNSPLDFRSPEYDSATTRKFIELLRKYGVRRILFNDPMMSTQKMQGHSNVIFACFDNEGENRKICDQFKYDPKLCGEL